MALLKLEPIYVGDFPNHDQVVLCSSINFNTKLSHDMESVMPSVTHQGIIELGYFIIIDEDSVLLDYLKLCYIEHLD